MTDKTKREKKTTTDCPCCSKASDECICGLTALVNLRLHEAGDICCIKLDGGLYTFVLIVDDNGVVEIHNFMMSNLATTIIFNCNTVGIREAFEAQADLARKHANFILKRATAKT
tara:strand:+ start:2891 stop:3235 length:345 start_codon:yes stop_codon:yes gene_type:complete